MDGKVENLGGEILNLERELNQITYRLHKLNDTEISMVERT